MEYAQNCSFEQEASSSSSNDLTTVIGDVISEKMVQEEKLLVENAIKEENDLKDQIMMAEKVNEELCYKRLNLLLSRSSIYAQFMAEKLKRDELKEARKPVRVETQKEIVGSQGRKRKKVAENAPKKKAASHSIVQAFKNSNGEARKENEDMYNNLSDNTTGSQPALLSGGIMHPYQIEGFQWLKVLFENGLNGILADEMGLGKTIQSIALIAYLVEMGMSGPYFVCGPLSTIPNWYAEFRRFAPSIPVLIYHGVKEERLLMLEKLKKKVKNGNVSCFPVIITSYGVALIDAGLLKRFKWTLLVIDEAHRIKNFQCKLIGALKLYPTSNRLLLTGTPLQNNLSELWSLLNFILPEIFDDLKVFESWFDITRLSENGGTDEIVAKEQEKQIVSIIHQILTPFLLRRTKVEVNLKLPAKKELIVHAPLTKLQQEYYTAVLNKTIEASVGVTRGKHFEIAPVEINSGRPTRNKSVDFASIYKILNDNKFEGIPDSVKKMCVSVSSKQEITDAISEINVNTRNVTMLLRKVCGHPYLLSYPIDEVGGYKVDEDLISNSGKLLVLDVMLPELKKRGHKILMFSQFVIMLRVLEDYCMYRKYQYNLLCGSTSLDDRQEQIRMFNESEDSFIFLISTRAGGLGLNLAAADTVIIYDSDWNPQSDLQAQDRCHRIGQVKPVVVYRLIIPNTIDEKIIDRATTKRKLEKVIIKKGRFNSKDMKKQYDNVSIEELIELLQSSDLSGFVKTDDNCVLSPDKLHEILDRSDMMESV